MKLPLSLPLCPKCEARFYYNQVKEAKKSSFLECPHCHTKITVSYRKQTALFVFLAVLLLIGINSFLMVMVPFINLIGLFLVTLIGVIIIFFLLPYTVRFK